MSNKQSHKKEGRVYKQTFLQRRHTDDQKAYEKMLTITNYGKNANEKYNEVSPHTSQNGHQPKICKQQTMECGKKGTLLHSQWERKLTQSLRRTLWKFLEKQKIELPYDLPIPLLVHIQRKP